MRKVYFTNYVAFSSRFTANNKCAFYAKVITTHVPWEARFYVGFLAALSNTRFKVDFTKNFSSRDHLSHVSNVRWKIHEHIELDNCPFVLFSWLIVVVVVMTIIIVIITLPYTYLSLAICRSPKCFINSSCSFITHEVISGPFYKLGNITKQFALLFSKIICFAGHTKKLISESQRCWSWSQEDLQVIFCSKKENRNCSQWISQQELHGTSAIVNWPELRRETQNSWVTVLRFLPPPFQENNVVYTDRIVSSFMKKK